MDRLKQVGNIKVIKVVDISKTGAKKQKFVVLSKVIVCVCCGAKNVELIKLQNCSHREFLECNFKSKINFHITFVCHYCHTLLKKINDFKQQIEKCLTDRQMMLNHQPKLTAFSKPVLIDIEPTTIEKLADIPHVYFEVPAFKPEVTVKDEPLKLKEEKDDSMDISDTVVQSIPMTVDFIKRKAEAMMQNEKNKDAKKEDLLKPVRSVPPSHHGLPVRKPQKIVNSELPTYLEPSDSDSGPIEITRPTNRLDDKVCIVRVTREELEKERDKERRDKKYTSMPFKCEDCIVGYPQEKLLISHLKNHDMSKGGYVCEVCCLVYTSEPLLRKHQQFHWKRYQCVPCGKKFKTSLFFCTSHYNENHVVNGEFIDRTFECSKENCNFICTNFPDYRRHRRAHNGRLGCNQCGNTYSTSGGLRQHIETVHENVVRVYKCIDCGKQYKSASGLGTHRQLAHGPVDKKSTFYCQICARQFRNQLSLNSHLKRHEEASRGKRFICDDCGAKYICKADIRNHIESVHLKKRYECKHCDKVYHVYRALCRHIKEKHTPNLQPEPKKLCHLCGKEFKSNLILKGHMTTHTGERPYKCCFCSATFGFSGALYTHKKLVHKQPKKRQEIK